MATKPRILFVSAGAPCRGFMAEGFARYLAGTLVEAETASQNPETVDTYCRWAMNEAGIDTSYLTAEPLSRKNLSGFSHVVAIGDGSFPELSNVPSGVQLEEWKIPDPTRVRAQPLELIRAYRAIRNEVERHVKTLLTNALGRKPS